jgi:hypothetical protein
VTPAEFKRTLRAKAAPPGCAPALAALWWARKGDWEKTHEIVMAADGRDAAWVHAYLHRREGDTGNAAYWYRQAQRPAATAALDAEWDAIVAALLAGER